MTSDPSGKIRALAGDELEELIEEDGTLLRGKKPVGQPDPPSRDLPQNLHSAATAHRQTPSAVGQQTGAGRAKDDSSAAAMFGAVLGSYRIVRLLGEGGMGQVFEAEHTLLGRRVALKLLRPEYAVKRDAVRRFFQEARAVNTIGHKNIVDVTDFVELQSGETFIIMEFLQGKDLGDLQRETTDPIPLHQAMRISLQICDALEAAHEKGIVHRDLKPDNIFVIGQMSDLTVKLLDFGVAKLLRNEEGSDSYQTAAGAVIGTPAYMSPEQAAGIPVDNRSDIYSLGAILYELFTGHPVFRAKSFGEFVIKHMNHTPTLPRDLQNAPRIPAALEHVIMRCLEKDPNSRYQAVTELREDLARATATVETVIHEQKKLDNLARRPRQRGWKLAAIAICITAAAAAAFWVAAGLSISDLTEGNKESPPVAAPDPRVPTRAISSPPKPQKPLIQKTVPAVASSAKVTLRTDPAGATVYRSGSTKPLGKTPLDVQMSGNGQRVTFSFRLAGYRPTEETITISGNTLIRLPLERLRDKRRKTTASKTTSTKPTPGKEPAGTPTTEKDPAAKKPPTKIRPEDTLDPFDD
jgi:eukaryotic-like serine/threonine-protein kinase